MHRFTNGQRYFAVNTRSWIPAGPVRGSVRTDRNHILTAPVDPGRRVHAKGHVPVVTLPGQFPVHVHLRCREDPVKIQKNSFTLGRRRQTEMLAIPSHPLPLHFARPAVELLLKGPVYGPVMRQLDRLPLAVVKFCRLGGIGIAAKKEPASIELQSRSWLGRIQGQSDFVWNGTGRGSPSLQSDHSSQKPRGICEELFHEGEIRETRLHITNMTECRNSSSKLF